MRAAKIRAEITPEHLRCFPGSCPAVYELDDGNLLIIGKKTDSNLQDQIKDRIADDEYAVVINSEFFGKFVEAQNKIFKP